MTNSARRTNHGRYFCYRYDFNDNSNTNNNKLKVNFQEESNREAVVETQKNFNYDIKWAQIPEAKTGIVETTLPVCYRVSDPLVLWSGRPGTIGKEMALHAVVMF